MRYDDFDVLVTAVGRREWCAQVIGSPGGQAAGTPFVLPFTAEHLELVRLTAGARHGLRTSVAAQLHERITSFGGQLFATVIAGDILACFHRSLGAATGGGLRLRLRVDDPSLADLPWELLHDPGGNRFLCLSERTPLVRYLPVDRPPEPLAVDGALRVLAVISNPDVDADPLDVEAEWVGLGTALGVPVAAGRIILDRLAAPTLAELRAQLRRNEYHVLHFVGHGRFNAADRRGELLFEDERGRGHAVPASTLAVFLHDHRSLRLAVLNACEGGRANFTDPYAGTAQTLIQQGVPAVVAMQFEISDKAAIAFATAFYGALAIGDPLDSATVQGRQGILTRSETEWATPVLYTRASDTRIFTTPRVAESPFAAPSPPRTSRAEGSRPADGTGPAALAMPTRPLRPAQPRRQRAASGGSVAAWGSNHYGQLSPPGELTNVVAVAAGGWHSLALGADGRVIGWGRNDYGQAAPPATLADVVAIAAGAWHSLALRADGKVIVWGRNQDGHMTVPEGLHDVVAVAAGDWHCLAVQADGRAVAWGNSPPTVPAELGDVVAAGGGLSLGLALRVDGTVVAWGRYIFARAKVPPDLSGVVAIAVGSNHCVALRSSGSVRAWGTNDDKQTAVPEGIDNVVAISAGDRHSAALRSDGRLVMWGKTRADPSMWSAARGLVAVSAGGEHTLAIRG